MPAEKPLDTLSISAVSPNKTYVGATFCSGDQRLHHAYGALDPSDCLAFLAARQCVQNGSSAESALEQYRVPEHVSQLAKDCLGKIASGRCLAFPTTPI